MKNIKIKVSDNELKLMYGLLCSVNLNITSEHKSGGFEPMALFEGMASAKKTIGTQFRKQKRDELLALSFCEAWSMEKYIIFIVEKNKFQLPDDDIQVAIRIRDEFKRVIK
jgi:hypothetical protein